MNLHSIIILGVNYIRTSDEDAPKKIQLSPARSKLSNTLTSEDYCVFDIPCYNIDESFLRTMQKNLTYRCINSNEIGHIVKENIIYIADSDDTTEFESSTYITEISNYNVPSPTILPDVICVSDSNNSITELEHAADEAQIGDFDILYQTVVPHVIHLPDSDDNITELKSFTNEYGISPQKILSPENINDNKHPSQLIIIPHKSSNRKRKLNEFNSSTEIKLNSINKRIYIEDNDASYDIQVTSDSIGVNFKDQNIILNEHNLTKSKDFNDNISISSSLIENSENLKSRNNEDSYFKIDLDEDECRGSSNKCMKYYDFRIKFDYYVNNYEKENAQIMKTLFYSVNKSNISKYYNNVLKESIND